MRLSRHQQKPASVKKEPKKPSPKKPHASLMKAESPKKVAKLPQSKAIKKTGKTTPTAKLASKLPKPSPTKGKPLIDGKHASPAKSPTKTPTAKTNVKSAVKTTSKSPVKNVNKAAETQSRSMRSRAVEPRTDKKVEAKQADFALQRQKTGDRQTSSRTKITKF